MGLKLFTSLLLIGLLQHISLASFEFSVKIPASRAKAIKGVEENVKELKSKKHILNGKIPDSKRTRNKRYDGLRKKDLTSGRLKSRYRTRTRLLADPQKTQISIASIINGSTGKNAANNAKPGTQESKNTTEEEEEEPVEKKKPPPSSFQIFTMLKEFASPTFKMFGNAVSYISKDPKKLLKPDIMIKDLYKKNKKAIKYGMLGGMGTGAFVGMENISKFKERFRNLKAFVSYRKLQIELEDKWEAILDETEKEIDRALAKSETEFRTSTKMLDDNGEKVVGFLNKSQEKINGLILRQKVHEKVENELRRKLRKRNK